MKKQWTATALVVALGLAAPVLAQDDPMPPQDDSSQRAAQQATTASATAGEEYVVQKGDTLSKIAERTLGSAGSWKQIADANSLSNPNMISVGQKLNIPQGSAEPASKSTRHKKAPSQEPDEHSGYEH